MQLASVLKLLQTRSLVTATHGDIAGDLTSVCDDSRRVVPGSLFVAVDGNDFDGHLFVDDAVGRGAVVVVTQREVETTCGQIIVSDSRAAAAAIAAAFYGNPAEHMAMVGVTGTNGKTTTVSLARHIFNSASDVGSIGTLGSFDGRGIRLENVPPLTTPGPVDLQAILAEMLERDVKKLAMEVSSHALSQSRVAELEFDVAVFTNLTHEHFDYHVDLADYLQAKLKLLEYLSDGATVVINADSQAWKQLATERSDTLSFSMHGAADVTALNVSYELGRTRFDLDIVGNVAPVTLPLAGEFNVANALAAAAAAHALGVSVEEIANRLSDAPQVPGRMEILHRGEFIVLRDYAHTPDAYERVLKTLRAATPGRLMILFGCGGDRDRKKRSVLASTASEMTDLVFVTTDNPRTEDPSQIFNDMEPGLAGNAYLKVDDRAEAIQRAISMLERGDTLLLAGKGHETYQLIGKDRIPFDEKSIVAGLLG